MPLRKCFSFHFFFFFFSQIKFSWFVTGEKKEGKKRTLEFTSTFLLSPFFMLPQFKIIMQWRYFLWAKFSVMWFFTFFRSFFLLPPSISNTFYLNVFSMLEHAKISIQEIGLEWERKSFFYMISNNIQHLYVYMYFVMQKHGKI